MGKIFLATLTVLLIAAGCNKNPNTQTGVVQNASQPPQTTPAVTNTQKTISGPITNALSRITKKPFGIFVTPQNSPVSPEKFTGFHTGVDFETFDNEQNIDVPIYAICDGKLLVKKYATGYGGVAVQSCTINNQDVTVIYGHLRLSSISPKIDQLIKIGDQIGVLGTGYSTETSGERKHFHLGIHKGTQIVLLGYVQNQTELNNWINAQGLLK